MTRDVLLVLAAVSTGLSAGVFLLYAHTVMPGLRRTDDRTFVGAFQALDRAIINPVFLLGSFFGAPLLLAVGAGLSLSGPEQDALPWLLAALVLHLVVVAITVAVHLPLNDRLKAAGDPAAIDVAAARAEFSEGRWVRANHIRVVLDVAAFAAVCVALVVGR
ncbi:DUF1772 domain-containing protein [Nocardioides sp. LHD-245]|uniref:anthrone oxygenase family protein n=1 Tax=Nocardioides sp. LHD-245 TaxID=3051387 RepID=UPI0027E19708|nr:DUF1772 domain-containing protein [Nocardioides sp. LHD-245]